MKVEFSKKNQKVGTVLASIELDGRNAAPQKKTGWQNANAFRLACKPVCFASRLIL